MDKLISNENSIENKSIKAKSSIFYDGQMFDAYVFVSDIIKSAKNYIALINNYVDESVLLLLSKRVKNCTAIIYIKRFDLFHNKFLIIDANQFYHICTSLKDLGKKWFGFSKIDKKTFEMMRRLK